MLSGDTRCVLSNKMANLHGAWESGVPWTITGVADKKQQCKLTTHIANNKNQAYIYIPYV